MPTNYSIEDMADFIQQEAEKQKPDYLNDSEIRATIQLLEQFSQPAADDFTLTVGEINAYMG